MILQKSKFASAALIGILIPGLLLQQACSSATETTAYGLVVAAVDAVVADLETTGTIPVQYAGEIQAVANASVAAEQETVTEEASSDTAAVKAQKIAGYWEPVIASVQGLPPTAQLIVDALVAAIKAYLAIVSPTDGVPAVDGSLVFGTSSGIVVVPAKARLDVVTKERRLFHIHEQRVKLQKVQAKFNGKK